MNNLEKYVIERQRKQYSSNPFITSLFAADPAAHVWNNKLFVYASRDIDKADAPLTMDYMDHYHVFSTEDMINWTDNGEILSSKQLNWGIEGFMWAPDAAFRNGKYYFYYPHPSDHPWNDNWKVGVAVSDQPDNHFKDLGPIEGLGGHALIDPSVFIDDDGQAYIYYGGGAHVYQGMLNTDMCSIKGKMELVEGLEDFHEAAWVFKRNKTYYFTYSDNHRGANHMCYATGPTALGPWKYQGYYMLPVGCETTHGSVVKFHEEWYAFYHNSAISNVNELRSICCDRLEFDENGGIKMVIQTHNGVPPIKKTNKLSDEFSIEIVKANKASRMIDLKVNQEKNSKFKNVVNGFSHIGSSLTFENIEGFNGQKVAVGIYYATEERLAKIRVIANDKDWSLINCPYTGSKHTFDGFATITIELKPGKNNTITLVGGSGDLYLEAISTQAVN